MDLNDINTLMQQYKREFILQALQQNKTEFENFCKQTTLVLQLPKKHDFHYFTDFIVKTRNRNSNAYETIDWTAMQDESFLEQYNFQDTIYETSLQNLCDYTMLQLGYIVAFTISPVQDTVASVATAQTFQKTCAAVKAMLNHNGRNLEYTTVKNYINFVIQKLLNSSENLNSKISLGEILKLKGLDKLYIGWQ